jgi:putative protein-disulfide isomerase
MAGRGVEHVTYVFDAYSGWCYAFASAFERFVAAHGHDFDVEAIPAGLFASERRASLGLTCLDDDTFEIAERTGVRFGTACLKLLSRGDFMLDSFEAARVFLALRSCVGAHDAELAASMQRAFFLHGQSLSAPETGVAIGARYRVSEAEVLAALGRTDDAKVARAFARAGALGVAVLPTVLLETCEGLFALCVGSATVDDLEVPAVLR